MKRRAMSPTKRLAFFLERGGICHLCKGKIQSGQAWDIEHVIPLAMGGDDELSNMMPAHRKCHSIKTRQADFPQIAKAKRRERARFGIRKRSTFACSRDSRFKKKVDGTVVLR